ncbi:MAG: AAA family ATPase [Alphaproteobacteria bacterium]|nr:AAA family ATPase [Alphaproteobacteria bacterium]
MPLSGYVEQHLVSEGRATVVTRGRRVADGRPVVVKRLRWLYPPPDRVAAFRRELDLTRRAASDGVIEALDLVEEDGSVCLVLEDFGATSVAAQHVDGPPALRDALGIALATARALQVVHARGLVHRDVNPSNIVRNPETGEVKLIDFGLSTPLARQTAGLRSLTRFAGTPAYTSPEQSGRTEGSVDRRSDLYSLGATLYELLVGRPPFEGTDRLELIHAHIARVPLPPHEVDPEVPEVVSRIVMRLLQKRPERRYQGAAGVAADLQRCLDTLTDAGDVPDFELGTEDGDDRLRIPERLYGRRRETGMLIGAFQRAAVGGREVLLVHGFPGIGKSSLVHLIQPSILECRGVFVRGKFDQLNRGVPYAPLVEGFRAWVKELLLEDEATVAAWRQRLGEAVEPNGRLLVDLVPELGTLLGPQPPVEEVDAAAAQHRLFHTMGRFVRAVAAPGHPLVLFLDDLQWADRPSLDLILELASDPATRNVLFLGAYRDNEVDEAHPLTLAKAALAARGAPAQELRLGPLGVRDVTDMLADTLGASPEEVAALATVCVRKTDGNPFFLGRFLLGLHASGRLVRDGEGGTWTWSVEEIDGEAVTDNVVDLLCATVESLPRPTRRALLAAAVIGNTFDLGTLAELLEAPRGEVLADLRPALDAELLGALDEDYWEAEGDDVPGFRYRFRHDRIQQAAASLLSGDERRAIHLALARLLQTQDGAEVADAELFRLVEHLHRAGDQVDGDLRTTARDLNLAAARRALDAAAFAPAHAYAEQALALAGPALWTEDAAKARSAHTLAARAAYLAGVPERMEEHVATVVARADDVLDRATALAVDVQARVSRGDLEGAIERALEVLASLGAELPSHPTEAQIGEGLQATLGLLGGRSPTEIAAGLDTDDPAVRLVLQLEALISVPAFISRPSLLPVLAFHMVRTSLERGVSPDAPYGFGLLGLFLCAVGLFDQATAQADTTRALLGRFEDVPHRARATHLADGFVMPWSRPLREAIAAELRVYALGLDTGDLEYACWGAHMASANAFWAGLPLDDVARHLDTAVTACLTHRQEPVLHSTVQFQAAVACLRGETDDPTRLSHGAFDEAVAMSAYREAGYRGPVAVTALLQTILRFLHGDLDGAVAAAEEALAHADGVLATYMPVAMRFYAALAHLQRHTTGPAPEGLLATVDAHREAFAAWATAVPENHAHRLALLDAERARACGDAVAAMDGYDRAVAQARRQGFTQDEALANELAGRFHLAHGRTVIARAYLTEARFAYEKWGARTKVAQLVEAFPELVTTPATGGTISGTRSDTSHGTVSVDLDVVAVAKAMTAIASEGGLEALRERIVAVALETAGGTSALLVLEEGGVLRVDASAHADRRPGVPRGTPLAEVGAVAQTVAGRVLRTGAPEVVTDARADRRLGRDLAADHPLAILCVPVQDQGVRLGALYVDNELMAGAFPAERVTVLQLLSTQAAIALNKARLLDETTTMARSFERFVPKAFLRPLSRERVVDIALGDAVTHQATVLFTDLRGFTRLFENIPPAEGFALLNHYLGRMTPLVEAHGGVVDKYVGDSIMALFLGAADDAVRAVVAMGQALRELNEDGTLPRGVRLATGSGLHAGAVALGTVGSEHRLDVTALGDTVNSAARLEALTSALGVGVLVSEEVTWRLRDPELFHLRSLGPVRLYGREEPLGVVEVCAADPETVREAKLRTRARFDGALQAYRAGAFEEAARELAWCAAQCPEDGVAVALHARALVRASGGRTGVAKGDAELV